MEQKSFDATEMLGELDGGVFLQKLSHSLSEAALATCEHDRKSKVTVEITMSRMGESAQVMMVHKIVSVRPTRRGTAKEDDATATPMFVGPRGALSIMPHSQRDLFDRDDKSTNQERNTHDR